MKIFFSLFDLICVQKSWAGPWSTGYCHGLVFKGFRVRMMVGAPGFFTTFPVIKRFNRYPHLSYSFKNATLEDSKKSNFPYYYDEIK